MHIWFLQATTVHSLCVNDLILCISMTINTKHNGSGKVSGKDVWKTEDVVLASYFHSRYGGLDHI